MNRRRLLALFGSTTVAGCLGGPATEETTTDVLTETTTDETTEPRTETTAETTSDETTTTAEPPEVGEPLPTECPVLGDDVERVVCYPGIDSPLSMTPSTDAASLPEASLSFTLSNDTDATFSTNFYAWRLYKQVDGEWYYLAPGMWAQPLHRLPPGDSHTWAVTIDNTDLGSEVRSGSSSETVLAFRGLGGGTYAFGIDGWFESQSYKHQIATIARFTLDGDPLSLSRTDSVESVERQGDTVVVRMPEQDTTETITVTRVEDSPEDPEKYITEQVFRHTALRNALASFEDGVTTVRVENVVNRMSSVVYLDGRKYVEYADETYEVEVSEETTTG